MRFETRAIYVFPLMSAALLCIAAPAHAGMSDWMDRAFTFREEQKPLLAPRGKTVPKMVYQPYYDGNGHDTWSTFYTRPDLEPQDYLSSSASKVMRVPQGTIDQGGWDAINARANANAADATGNGGTDGGMASMGNIAIGEPGQGPGVLGSTAEVGRKTIIGEAVRDWREDADGSLRSRPGDYDYRTPNLNRPAKVDSRAIIEEPLDDPKATALKKIPKQPDPALRNDPRYASFNDDGQVTGYVVQTGDTLSTIAGQEAIYGKTTLWPLIYSANRKAIGGSPKNLKLKQNLVIPRDYTDKQAKEAEKKGAKLR